MKLSHMVRHAALALTFKRSDRYWEQRYRVGLDSGLGSYGDLARFKAEVINEFVRANAVRSVVEFGCGDGNQLELADYPSYLGLDVAATAIDLCRRRYAGDRTKSFLWYDPERTVNLANFLSGDLTLSLDVIYHLVEDRPYRSYLGNLFSAAQRFVIVYSSDREDGAAAPHVRHRRFTADVERDFPDFRLLRRIENRYPERSFCSFFIYERARA
jgi:SAM-dependent methyltransferase